MKRRQGSNWFRTWLERLGIRSPKSIHDKDTLLVQQRPNVRMSWEPEAWFRAPAYDAWQHAVDELLVSPNWSFRYQQSLRGQVFASLSNPKQRGSDSGLSTSDTDDRAFHEAQCRYRAMQFQYRLGCCSAMHVEALHTPVQDERPTRLINIDTGQVEDSDEGVPYLVGSYIWRPQLLPRFPRTARRSSTLSNGDGSGWDYPNEWEYSSKHFDAVVGAVENLVANDVDQRNHWILERCTSADNSKRRFPAPDLGHLETEDERAYILEVYYELVAEAQIRRVSHVWMDILCINQRDPVDVAREIPRMTSYYRSANCCVVISEMLRRRYSHSLDHLGHDVLDPTYADCALANMTDEHRQLYGLENEVIGWLIGFHQLRLWVFQETLLPEVVVHRGSGLRLNTNEILVHGIRPVPFHDQNIKQEAFQDSLRALFRKRLPLNKERNMAFNNAMVLLRDQKRTALRENDYVYGVFALCDAHVRTIVPVNYDMSLSALTTIVAYARVCAGDMRALHFGEEASSAATGSGVRRLPSWLPRSLEQMAMPDSGYGVWCGTDPPEITTWGALVAEVDYYRIQSIRRATTKDVELADKQNEADEADPYYSDSYLTCRLQRITAVEEDVVLQIAVCPSKSVKVCVSGRDTIGEGYAFALLQESSSRGEAVIACLDSDKTVHRWLVLFRSRQHYARNVWVRVGFVELYSVVDGLGLHDSIFQPSRCCFTII